VTTAADVFVDSQMLMPHDIMALVAVVSDIHMQLVRKYAFSLSSRKSLIRMALKTWKAAQHLIP
jgi:hypothetical protein